MPLFVSYASTIEDPDVWWYGIILSISGMFTGFLVDSHMQESKML